MAAPGDVPSDKPWWQKLGWFVLLWAGGVLVTFAVAGVFKLLILGAVTH